MFTKRSPRRMRYASAFLGYLRRAVSWPKKQVCYGLSLVDATEDSSVWLLDALKG